MCESYRGPFHQEWINREFTPPMQNGSVSASEAIAQIREQLAERQELPEVNERIIFQPEGE